MTESLGSGFDLLAPDFDLPAVRLQIGDEVEHCGSRCTISSIELIRPGILHIKLSNGRQGEVPTDWSIGIYNKERTEQS